MILDFFNANVAQVSAEDDFWSMLEHKEIKHNHVQETDPIDTYQHSKKITITRTFSRLWPFSTYKRFLTPLQQTTIENNVTKDEIAQNDILTWLGYNDSFTDIFHTRLL